MASCNLGALKISSINLRTARNGESREWNRTRTLAAPAKNVPQFASLRMFSQSQSQPLSPLNCIAAGIVADTKATHDVEEAKPEAATSQLIPNASEVQSLVEDLCDTTSIAEFELKLNGFRLYVVRDLNGGNTPPPTPPSPSPAATISVDTELDAPSSNDSVSVSSLSISKLQLSTAGVPTLLDKAADEGLVILKSPRVGFFRRCLTIKGNKRTIKGNKRPPACQEKQLVKEGQVLCYIEQLSGEIPVESEISGEIVKILQEDGEAVGYGDALIAILPSFPGIKKLQ